MSAPGFMPDENEGIIRPGETAPSSAVTPNGAGPLPPSVVPIVPPTEYGPPAPDPTDSIAANLPPPIPGIPTRDQDQEIAPGVPREAPGNVGAAPALNPPPGMPAGPQDDSLKAMGTGTADVKEAQEKEKAAREESAKAQTDQLEAGQDVKDAEAVAAQKRQDVAAEHIKQAQAIQDQYDQADKAAQAQVQQTQQALKDFKFKDYWADKSSAQKVLSSLGVALGAFGAGLTKTPNYALEILNKDMDRDHQLQVDHLNQLTNEEVMARTGIAESRAARQRAMADLTLTDAAKDKMIASQLETAAAKSTDQNYQNVLTAQAAKLREEAAAKDKDATVQLRSMNLGDQQAALAARKEASEEEARKAQEEYEKAHGAYWEHGGAKGRHGSGGGASTGAAYDKFRAAVMAGQTDNIGALAAAAHLRPNQIQGEILKIRTETDKEKTAAGTAAKSGAGNTAGDRLLSKEAESWKKENGVDTIAKTQRELGALQKEMADNAHNPLQQALAVEKAVSAARGGAASKQALGLALGHLGGSLDNAEGVIQKIKDGEIGEKQLQNFNSFIRGQLGAAQAEGKNAFDNFNKYIETQPPEKKAALEAERGRIFSGLHGFGGSSGGGGESELVRKARAAANDPTRRPEVRAAAQKILDQQGASGG